MSTKRITAIQAEVEYGGSKRRRITAEGAMVEYGGSSTQRITAIGVMVEYQPDYWGSRMSLSEYINMLIIT